MSNRSSSASFRRRLDLLLVERGLAGSREKAQALIKAGDVMVGDAPADKPGRLVARDAPIRVRQPTGQLYISRGGLKLAAAPDAFSVDPTGLTAVDVGASTGGFTDCLLQRGAARVFAIDVGYGQLDQKLRQDPRVACLERTNIRTLRSLPGQVLADLAVIDVSFIGLEPVLPAVAGLLRPAGWVIALIKPQFEAGRGRVGKAGVVKDSTVHREVLLRVLGWASSNGWRVRGLIRSPITGSRGNLEFLCWLEHGQGDANADAGPLVDSLWGRWAPQETST